MAVSFTSSASSFVGSYGSLFLPIAADYATTALFKRATCFGKAQFAGLIVGVGVSCYCASRTSWTIGLAGIALYTLYKTVAESRSHPTHSANPTLHMPKRKAAIVGIRKSFHQLLKKMSYPSDKALDHSHPQLRDHVKDLKVELKPQIDRHCQQLWEHPETIAQTRSLMIDCQSLLYKIDLILDQKTQDLQADPKARMKKKAELLNDNSHAFHEAFYILTRIYRMIRCQAYTISLPNIQNFSEETCETAPWGAEITVEYCNRFMQGDSPQRELNRIFNETQAKLADLVNTVRSNCPYHVKDEQPVPADYSNPTNPFWIFPRETPVK